jgi:hypothetical protein
MPDRPKLTLAPVTAPSQPEGPPAPVTPSDPAPAVNGSPAAEPVTPAAKRRRTPSTKQPAGAPSATSTVTPAGEPWRKWGPFHQTVSFKWPPELAAELEDRRYKLREPVGLMVVAALTHFLDQDDEAIRVFIDRAEQAKPRGGRPRRST